MESTDALDVEPPEGELDALLRAIARDDEAVVTRLLAAAPALARAASPVGATRSDPETYYLAGIGHYLYAGDTPLHVAAAGYRVETARRLLALGADPRARNRRGAEPLHYAAAGRPGSRHWDPEAQAATLECLLSARADLTAADRGAVTPLPVAVRTRCAAAVRVLLARGADPRRTNASGTTPLRLARLTTGRGGTGTLAARAQQAEIVRLLIEHGAEK